MARSATSRSLPPPLPATAAGTDPAGDPLAPRLSLRLHFGETATFGRGKAELLERIRDEGSISAAGRVIGMSYKRAWDLVSEMNAAFARPLVASTRGGPGGGGAVLTEMGTEVLWRYRSVEAATLGAGGSDIAALRALLAPPGTNDALVAGASG